VNQREIDDLWFSHQYVPGAAFRLNDSVRIKSGDREGEVASVIALLLLEPTPTYLVELAAGSGDVEAIESAIEATG
jgi:hypothetical protein